MNPLKGGFFYCQISPNSTTLFELPAAPRLRSAGLRASPSLEKRGIEINREKALFC